MKLIWRRGRKSEILLLFKFSYFRVGARRLYVHQLMFWHVFSLLTVTHDALLRCMYTSTTSPQVSLFLFRSLLNSWIRVCKIWFAWSLLIWKYNMNSLSYVCKWICQVFPSLHASPAEKRPKHVRFLRKKRKVISSQPSIRKQYVPKFVSLCVPWYT